MVATGKIDRVRCLWRAIAIVLAVLAPRISPADAADSAASEWFVTDQGRVRLIAAAPSIDGGTVHLGLEFEMAPHWKIYWRSPGDAGYPPHLDWTGSRNLAGADVAWPAPRRFSVQGLQTVGYETAVVLPISARLADAAAPLHAELALDYLTCREICIPYQTTLTLDLGSGGEVTHTAGYAERIASFQARVPAGGSTDLAVTGAMIEPGVPPVLVLRLSSREPLGAPDAFVEGPPGVAFGAPALAAGDAPGETLLRLPATGVDTSAAAVAGQPLTITVVDGTRAVEAVVTPTLGQAPTSVLQFASMLGLALLGGFILNLMPCVLPVLSIKLLSVIEHRGRSRLMTRLGFLATAVGIVGSFLALALAMIGLKAAGIAVGWGLQFQQPPFLIAMALLLTAFACNLWGLFEVPLPSVVGRLATTGNRRALLGNVVTGAFATLLATPCSAPFLGTAVGFALAGGPVEILTIFFTLGIGLAAPYLLVAIVPRIAQLLPRPGHWMVTIRRVLGGVLALTVAWLVFVLTAQIGLLPGLLIGALMVLLMGVLAWRQLPPPLRRGAALLLLIGAFLVPGTAPKSSGGGDYWRPFDRAAIADLVRHGHVVFVDVTAAWCATCKANELFVLDTAAVHRALTAAPVVAMRADWTQADPAITAYLRKFGRYGIPFNAVYGPGTPDGQPLSELLTVDQINAALARAATAPNHLGSVAP